MTIDITKATFMKYVQFAILVAILGLLLWSQPWNKSSDTAKDARTISVSGSASVDAEPDKFVFYPYFEERDSDEEAAKTRLTERVNIAVEKLKGLGIEDKNIELDASEYEQWYWDDTDGGGKGVVTASIQVTVDSQEKAQEVQDFFLTQNTNGQITPQGSFSKEKEKELETQATELASKDARAKAEAQATLFGAELGDVVSLDQGGKSYPDYYGGPELSIAESSDDGSTIPVLPGQDEYSLTVNVTYELVQ